MDKIKILQFSIGNVHGGVTQYALKNWEFINKDRFQFDFVTLSKELDFEQELTRQGCKIHYLSCYAEENEKQFIKEINHILDEKYDVVHLHTNFWRSFTVEGIAIQRKVPKIIVHSHNTMIDILDNTLREDAIRIHQNKRQEFSPLFATDFWACSNLAADWLFGEQIPKEQVVIMKNAIDVKQFSYDEKIRNKYRKKMNLEECFVLGHIGRFVYQKNHEMLIDVFNIVCKRIPNARLMLIGTGRLEEDIRKKARGYGIEDKVLFLGKRKDVHFLLQAMDLFLLPSRFEGLPIVLIEAQATGIRCITSTSVTTEVAITDQVKFLPLDCNVWAEYIIQNSIGYDRKNVDDLITSAGYNIRFQIKEVEKLYAGERS